MFEENIEIIKSNFLDFAGKGFYLLLFLISIIYIFIKDKDKRIFFVYYNIFVGIIVLNPIFNKIVGVVFKPEVYWRVFWLFLLGPTIAYAMVKFVLSSNNKLKNTIICFSMILIVALSGKIIYNNENYEKMFNLYKLPDESIKIANVIGEDDEENKKALVSERLVAYIRQVDASIELAYKRDPQSYLNNKFVNAMLSGNSELIADLAIQNKCNYIVLRKDIPLTLDMGYFGFRVLDMTDNYVIYKIQ